ncbi:MAG TPA: MgtC/SapB family protein [Thermoanaerobaculia bacterium]|nr:MgtC/SapB family protein [Thermoanaerobaculia bacterium]
MELAAAFLQLGIAAGLGLLVGLQRERKAGEIAGFRTFPLVTLTGTLCGQLALAFDGWVLAGGFVAVAALVVIGNVAKMREGEPDRGITTEVAVVLMFAVGAYLTVGPPQVAVAVGAAVAVLLQLKQELHGFATRVSDADLRAVMQFAAITLIVLPVLPNRTYGPYDVLNPRQVWWMVVLIVAISLAGYVGSKLLGARAGTWLGGALGGLVSSTATTVTFARRTRGAADDGGGVEVAAQVVLIASAVVYLRVLVEIAVVAPQMLVRAWGPLLVMLVLLAAMSLLRARRHRLPDDVEPAEQGNPTQLRAALLFGLIYAVVVLVAAWAKAQFGSKGLYAVAGISGLVDLEAITLSSAQSVRGGKLAADLAWRLVLLATLANIAFKTGIVALWGGRALLRRVAPYWAAAVLVGLALLAWWPGETARLR